MMKKLTWTAVPLALGILAGTSIPVYAEGESDITVSIDQKQISLTELQESNYEVPIFIRLNQIPALNAIEFGIEVDTRCRFDIVTRSVYAQLYGEELGIMMESASTSGIDGYAWLTWMQMSDYYAENGESNIAMLLVTVPESAEAGDIYPIRYLTESPLNPEKQHVWYNFGQNTNYAKIDTAVVYSAGFIKITGEGETEYIAGDVDQNGSVNILDAIKINRTVLGKEILTDIEHKAADLDGDGMITATDSLILLKMLVGIIE